MASIKTIPTPISHHTLQTLPKSSPILPQNLSFPAANTASRPLIAHRTHASSADNIRIVSSDDEMVSEIKLFNESSSSRSKSYLSMYSSVYGVITIDPAWMIIPIDDHMVHRGHGVFDTAAIKSGHLYELDQHLDRFLRSASMADIELPFDRESIRKILIQTASASKCKNGSLRYWLSSGPGDFQLTPSTNCESALYAVVYQDLSSPTYEGVKVVTSSIPIKPQEFATMKSTNYLPNVLCKREAEKRGLFASIWVDSDGLVAEGPNMNVAFVTKEKELVMPQFDKILSGCTAKRVLSLAENMVKGGRMLSGISVRNVGVEEGKSADEMMLIGSGVLVRPVVQWDDQIIGNGRKGPIAQELLKLVLNDMESGPPEVRVPVPY